MATDGDYGDYVDHTPIGIVHATHDLRIVYSNERAHEILGYRAAEFLQLRLVDLVARESLEHFRHEVQRSAGTKRIPARLDCEFIDVERRPVRVRVNLGAIPSTGESGNGLICVFDNADEDVRPETAIKHEWRLLMGVIDAIPQYIYVKDDSGRFVIANRAWRDVRGLTSEALRGKTVYDIFPREIAERLDGYDREVLNTGKDVIDLEHPINDAALRDRWAVTSKVAIRDDDGMVTALVGISRDITEQRRGERERAMEHAVTRVISESLSLDSTINRLLKDIAQTMGWSYGARWVWHAESSELRRNESWFDSRMVLHSGEFDAWMRASAETVRRLRERAFETGKSAWTEEMPKAADFFHNATQAGLSFRTVYAFPILAEGSALGVMEFYSCNRWEPDETFAEATVSVGNQIGQFIRRKSAEEALAEREEQFRAIFDNADVGITLTALDGRFIKANGRYCSIVGYTPSELEELTVFALNLDKNVDATKARRAALLDRSAVSAHQEKQIVRKDGTLIWVSVATSVIRSTHGTPCYFLAVVQDISATKSAQLALEQSEEQFRQLANNIPQVFWIADAGLTKLLYISPACEELYGVTPAKARERGRRLLQAIHPDDRRSFYQERRKLLAGETYTHTYRVFRHDGTVRWVEDRGFPIFHSDGTLHRVAGITADVTEEKRAEERLMILAHYDGLTNLPNRSLLQQRLRTILERASRTSASAAIMFLDLDRFKHINDTFGHPAGDRILREAAIRIAGAVRSDDTVARLGGDEFAIVLPSLEQPSGAELVAEKIVAVFNEPFIFDDSPVFITTSIGIAIYPQHGLDADTLLKNADVAMYAAKDAGRNRYAFFHSGIAHSSLDVLMREAQFRNAVANAEFVIHYQPKVELSSMKVVGFEALLRWNHPTQGLLTAGDFFDSLEQSDFIVAAGEWIIESVCEQLASWRQEGLNDVCVAVNLSAKQFNADLEGIINGFLTKHRITPQQIQFEITESSIAQNTEEAIQTLRRLSAKGMHICIDDFGTGYSSLINLKRYPLNTVKIDRSFIRDIHTDPDDAAIVKAVISMAHALDLRVVAEGVETEEQLRFLRAEGCDEVQGFYFFPAIAAPKCVELLRSVVVV